MGGVDAASKLNWPSILEKASQSPLGIMALAMIILGGVAVVLFYKEKDPRYRAAIFVILLLGFGIGALSIQKASVAGELSKVVGLPSENCNKLKGEELIKCLKQRK